MGSVAQLVQLPIRHAWIDQLGPEPLKTLLAPCLSGRGPDQKAR